MLKLISLLMILSGFAVILVTAFQYDRWKTLELWKKRNALEEEADKNKGKK